MRIIFAFLAMLVVAGCKSPYPSPPLPRASARAVRAIPVTPSVGLIWDASDAAGATYMIHWGGSSGNYPNTADAGAELEYIVTGLTPGETYYFAASAVDTAGLESVFSNEAVYTVPAAFPSGTVTITLVMRPTVADSWEVVSVNSFPVTNSQLLFNNIITYEP